MAAKALQQILGSLPPTLRDELIEVYSEIVRNYRERRWEPSELNAGKFCEVVYSVLRGHVDGAYPARSTKPSNMVDACRSLEQADSVRFSRSVRIQIPRMLIAVYEVRNNRGVGHTGGDVDANLLDATCVLHICQWILAELIRIFHSVTIDEAQGAVEAVVERLVPLVWKVDGRFRVLDPSLSMKEKALVLLYHQMGAVTESDLLAWVEHSNAAVFRRDVLRRAHKEKLLEYDATAHMVTLSPKGITYVEEKILSEAGGNLQMTRRRS